ncbi:MAG: MmgE/PrpD family protein [Dehalococcoidia bacterium]|nr:MmgE/PrpD family protein [Dehalococcoidia bacterium]
MTDSRSNADSQRDGAPTAALARFIATARVPADVRQTARRYVLDWLGSTIAGGELRPPSLVRDVVAELGGTPQATVLATGERTSAPLAALANASAAHVLEMDDLDRGSIFHPAAPVVAAALAVAEREHADGEALLDAVTIGYEAGIRVGEALGPSHYEHWHTTGTAGTFGATAAAARLAGLDEAQTLQALGSAGTMTAGLWEFLADGAMSKQLHPAKAAHDGILAVMLAARGFTAASRILEGPKGVLSAMSDAPDPARVTDGLSADLARWRIEGVSFKVHASCRHTHSAVDAALVLRARHGLRPDDIEAVEVRLYRQALGLLEGMEPTTPYAAKFSLPFCVAVALEHGDLAPQRFTDDTIAQASTLALTDRVRFVTDPELDALYPAAWPSVVTVTTRGGEVLSERVDHPSGDPESDIDEAAIAAKFETLTGPILGPGASEVSRLLLTGQPAPDAATIVRLSVARPSGVPA